MEKDRLKEVLAGLTPVDADDIDDAEKPPRYVSERKYANGTVYYRYAPNKELREAGVVEGQILAVGEENQLKAYQLADELNKKVDEYLSTKSGKSSPAPIKQVEEDTIRALVSVYKGTGYFKNLSEKSQETYRCFLDILVNEEYNGRLVGDYAVDELTVAQAQEIYQQLKKSRGNSSANHINAVISRVCNVAAKSDLTFRNPWRHVETKKVPPREVTWTDEQVSKFLAAGMQTDSVNRRAASCIFLMAYVFAQRLGDMRVFKKSSYDSARRAISFRQSKRGAKVWLPVPEWVADILDEHLATVPDECPYAFPKDNNEPFRMDHLSKILKAIREDAGLPSDLWASDMRRTTLTEMGKSGVGLYKAMAVSGHKHLQSMEAYMELSGELGGSAIEILEEARKPIKLK